ncbi:4-pyridoxate dehydrogenase-like isoform X2 [Dermacentor andersoni]|uniref:4-pyridoxate dehydrogenase-like isoform X2 n=1 Tax=Dermacentor andersoni TaxID=34620 RepID=UPI0024165AAB|nr:4-pyridoxate dehydrogenase-like isoform X2 [Dermacentor andersoni]XP_054932505.1 4-pyridoxate dehydrogenase-like isoform X2 [Dermacentor andersoni]
MIGDLDSMSCALWGRGAVPQSELGLFLALVNLLIHLPFTDLPVLRDYELGELRKQYDYVIVGGGSAGCVIANRLSTNPSVTVLLLEAGGLETASRQIPAAAPFNLRGHDDWDYHSVPQSNAALSFREQVGTSRLVGAGAFTKQMVSTARSESFEKVSPHTSRWLKCLNPSLAFLFLVVVPGPTHVQRLSLSRGKVLGGSSVLNFLLYMRGNPKDYDRWVREYGATGWGYEDVLPHYKEIEDYRAGPLDQYHGSGGEVPVDTANTSTLLSHLLLEACNELGYPYVDYNGPTQSGCSRAQANVANGERFSSSKAFIQSVVGARKNLHVALFSQVTKVNFEGRQAVGVSFSRYGKPQDVLARREVILSAGTVGSAQLLLLSGVGPKEQLERLQIPVIADLPVGRNLQDHVVLQMAPPVSMNVNAGIPPFGLDDIEQYNWNKTGTISIPASTEFVQFLHTDHATDADIPDIEIAPISTSPASELFKSAMVELGLLPEAFDGIIGPTDGRLGFRSIVILNRPKSRGAITLRSADPYDHPDIDPRILDHPDDVKRAAEGTRKFIDEVLGTAAMQSIGAEPWNVTFPPCAEAGSLWSQNYTECLFRHAAHTMWHLCCTVAMGSHSEAVLDERLRVRGNVTNLRVADASVMPDIASGHTNAVAMMIGSKAAAMIIEDYEERRCHDV